MVSTNLKPNPQQNSYSQVRHLFIHLPHLILYLLTEKEQHSLALLPPIRNISFSSFFISFQTKFDTYCSNVNVAFGLLSFSSVQPCYKEGLKSFLLDVGNNPAREILCFPLSCRAYSQQLVIKIMLPGLESATTHEEGVLRTQFYKALDHMLLAYPIRWQFVQ